MTIHLIRMAAGLETVEALRERQKDRLKNYKKYGGKRGILRTYTRNVPKREEELLDGGSIYWVLKNHVRVRQRVLGIDRESDDEGRGYCMIRLDPELVLVEPRHHKAFQGWRYLRPEDAPPDLGKNAALEIPDLPAAMADELRALGLL